MSNNNQRVDSFLTHYNGIISAVSYASSSVCILIFNKIVLSSYKFNFPVIMTLFHMLVCVVLLSVARHYRLLNYKDFDRNLAWKALPLSLCFVSNIVIGMIALKLTSIPMFATLRRLNVVMVLCYESLILRQKTTPIVISAVLIMVFGSVVGGWGDLHFDLVGYAMIMLNNLITTLYLNWTRSALANTTLVRDTFGLMYYNSLLSLPFLVAFAYVNGEWSRIGDFSHLQSVWFQLSFATSALMSFAMNYSTFWCTQANSALTTSVTGQVKNVLTSLLSIVILNVQSTPLLITGLCIGLSGSFLYGYAMYDFTLRRPATQTPLPIGNRQDQTQEVDEVRQGQKGTNDDDDQHNTIDVASAHESESEDNHHNHSHNPNNQHHHNNHQNNNNNNINNNNINNNNSAINSNNNIINNGSNTAAVTNSYYDYHNNRQSQASPVSFTNETADDKSTMLLPLLPANSHHHPSNSTYKHQTVLVPTVNGKQS